MAFEVIPRLGEVRTSDLRRILGVAFPETKVATIVIPPGRGTPPYRGLVSLRLVRAGRGWQNRLVCPGCKGTKIALQVSERGGLACKACLGLLTRRQRERSCQTWRGLGGEQEDEILRLALRPGLATEGRLALLQEKIEALLKADLAMVNEAMAGL